MSVGIMAEAAGFPDFEITCFCVAGVEQGTTFSD